MLLKGEKYAVQALNLNVVAAFREISLQNLRWVHLLKMKRRFPIILNCLSTFDVLTKDFLLLITFKLFLFCIFVVCLCVPLLFIGCT